MTLGASVPMAIAVLLPGGAATVPRAVLLPVDSDINPSIPADTYPCLRPKMTPVWCSYV